MTDNYDIRVYGSCDLFFLNIIRRNYETTFEMFITFIYVCITIVKIQSRYNENHSAKMNKKRRSNAIYFSDITAHTSVEKEK